MHTETARIFVEKGGLDLLLKLHTLPRLVYTFGFSAHSHPLLGVFRTLSPQHAQVCDHRISFDLGNFFVFLLGMFRTLSR